MIKRIVKLTFEEDKIPIFLNNFEQVKDKIRAVDGCHHLELWRATSPNNVFFTYSYWVSEEHLNAYRYSELFRDVWTKTKILFADKPQAWSIEVISETKCE